MKTNTAAWDYNTPPPTTEQLRQSLRELGVEIAPPPVRVRTAHVYRTHSYDGHWFRVRAVITMYHNGVGREYKCSAASAARVEQVCEYMPFSGGYYRYPRRAHNGVSYMAVRDAAKKMNVELE